jgi:hypothetical protein
MMINVDQEIPWLVFLLGHDLLIARAYLWN